MRVLVVTKRHPQQRDLIERPYGRFFHLPVELARLGHQVRVQLCGYRRLPSLLVERNGVSWSSHDFLTLGLRKILGTVLAEARAFRPDWIVAVSDTWPGWMSHWLSRRLGGRLAIDAYDNYESYMRWNLPLHWQWRRAVHAAQLVTAAGPDLAGRLALSRSNRSDVRVLPMSADPAFVPIDRSFCRGRLDLPSDLPLFGYSGGWTTSRGSDLILDAFARVRSQVPDARLVLTGRPPAHALAQPGVISLGYVPDSSMPLVTNAVDVCCVILANTAFGRYSHPAKLCEAMACGIPVVASATDTVTWMLANDRRFLARVGDAADHARLMIENLRLYNPNYVLPPTWAQSATQLSIMLGAADRPSEPLDQAALTNR